MRNVTEVGVYIGETVRTHVYSYSVQINRVVKKTQLKEFMHA